MLRLQTALPTLMLVNACVAPQPPEITGAVAEEEFRSSLVDGDYLLRIRTPPDLDESGSYPLIIQLDPTFVGLRQFDWTAGLVSTYAASGEWPEAVVVGVDYPDPFTRERDYRPPEPPDPAFGGEGADRFYRVLRDEILPYLQDTLPVAADRRLLVGHSNGGVFGWYTAFRHTPPEAPLFVGVLAADTGLEEVMFTYERWHAERADNLPIALFATHALYNGAGQKIVHDAMAARLRARGYSDLRFTDELLETDHGGAVRLSYEPGLAFLLKEAP